MGTKETMKTKERKAYIPAQVTIIEMAQETVICQSPGAEFSPYTNGGTY